MTRRANRIAGATAPQVQGGGRSAHDAESCVSGQTAGAGGATESATGDGWELRRGDCLVRLRELADASVDAIVTDPPAGIGFMGKDWDSDKGGRDAWIAWLTSVMAECLRVLKPGGHAVVWALPRTSHWTATAIEDAGFEIRDVHHHIFGTGFPKSLNVSSVMHELLGVTDGEYGTALKPAVEHWVLARKPLVGTYAANIRAHGTGALNVGAARIGTSDDCARRPSVVAIDSPAGFGRGAAMGGNGNDAGRWPAHLSLDEYAAALLDEMSGVLKSGSMSAGTPRGDNAVFGKLGGPATDADIVASAGGASRFFYVAKGSRAEKDRGLELMPRISGGKATGRVDGSAGTRNPRAGAGRTGGARNIHPTVKSIELMRWLVRLVAPRPGSLVVDPFAGSGTTGLGCIAEGMRFLGFERDENDKGEPLGYFDIATARLDAATRQQVLPVLAMRPEPKREESLQVDLLEGLA